MQNILLIMQLLLSFGNLCILGYAFFKFLNKPRNELEDKVKTLEDKIREHEIKINSTSDSLKKGNDRFRMQEQTNVTFKSVMLSFINFEIAYCLHTGYEHSEELYDAKKELENYLTGNNHEKD